MYSQRGSFIFCSFDIGGIIMNNNYLEYILTPTNLLMISSIEFDPNDEWIKQIILSSMTGQFHFNIKFVLKDEVIDKSQTQLVQKCNYSYGIKLFHPHFVGLFLDGQRQPATYQGKIIDPVTLTKSDEESLLNQICLVVQKRNSNVYKRLYRNVLQIADPIARFMLLYSLMQLALGAESQKELDNFIKISKWYNASLDRVTTRKGSDIKETIYSWLRNAIGHTQETYVIEGKEYNFEEILEELDQFVDTLSLITKQAIENRKI
jgi:hypothetical protein